MQGFPGFPAGSVRQVPLPEPFFSELLPLVDHLGELKVILYALWRLNQKTGRYRWVARSEFAADTLFLRGLSPNPRQAEVELDTALERAEARGALLAAAVRDDQGMQQLYFVNTPLGREALENLAGGRWQPDGLQGQVTVTLSQIRSSLFTQYEQNIGPLTPMVAEELRELQADYPAAWIEEAIRIAVRNNARRLKYVQAVLKRMQTEGHHAQEDRSDPGRYDGYRPFVEDDDSA